jgi:hypothetical protein
VAAAETQSANSRGRAAEPLELCASCDDATVAAARANGSLPLLHKGVLEAQVGSSLFGGALAVCRSGYTSACSHEGSAFTGNVVLVTIVRAERAHGTQKCPGD